MNIFRNVFVLRFSGRYACQGKFKASKNKISHQICRISISDTPIPSIPTIDNQRILKIPNFPTYIDIRSSEIMKISKI